MKNDLGKSSDENEWPPREFLTTDQAANYLSISPNALRACVCRGQIRLFKLGRRLRFRLEDLRRLILFGEDRARRSTARKEGLR